MASTTFTVYAYGNIFIPRITSLSNFFISFFSITESFSITKNSAISLWLNKNPPTQKVLLLLILFLKSDPLLSQIY